ncbi:hypothetical protein GJ496_001112 [Pomphorhynchus laevis]|nr:hypothetical protein GJ496_001112 [Pomphorhynchus laevis]
MNTLSEWAYDPDFCQNCGTIFPLPGLDENEVKCVRCNESKSISEFGKISFSSMIDYDKLKLFNEQTGINMKNFEGCMVDHLCTKCGAEKMAFYTRQTRSADEGQTIFYECKKCGNREIEYS